MVKNHHGSDERRVTCDKRLAPEALSCLSLVTIPQIVLCAQRGKSVGIAGGDLVGADLWLDAGSPRTENSMLLFVAGFQVSC